MQELSNVLKNMESETHGVKNDIINYLLNNSNDSEDIQILLEDINNYGCESGIVNHLIYYTDTVAYFEKHEDEIQEMINNTYSIDLYSMGVEEFDKLMNILNLDSFEDRLNNIGTHEEALKRVAYDNNISIDKADTKDYEEEVFTERYYIATELGIADKNYLAWAIFEYNASVLIVHIRFIKKV